MATNSNDVNQMLQKGTVLRGIYRIDDYLASGGFGNTYLATNLEFDEQVAIKEFYMRGVLHRNDDSSVSVSNSENVEMFDKLLTTFKREAKRLRMLAKKKCEHIIKVYDIFDENSTSYYVMQYIKGKSLGDIMKGEKKPFEQGWLMDSLLPQMLEALEVIHEDNMWHLDIKPSNIMIDNDGNAYLIDFGSSKQLDPASGNATLSSTLSFTRNYAPLELQEYNLKKIGPWTDLYSLGATLYNLATNQTPPSAYNILSEGADAFKFGPESREDLKKLVLWMMNHRAEDRPQIVAQVKDFVNGELTSEPGAARNGLSVPVGVLSTANEVVPPVPNSEETLLSTPASSNQSGTLAQYYIGINNQQLGPFEVDQLLVNGLTPDTLVWCNGMAGWEMAKNVPELSRLFVTQQPKYQQQQYAQPQYQQPQYQQAYQQNSQPMPDSNMVWAILSTLFCCLPTGIVAIVKASNVSGLYSRGDYEGAVQAANDAKKWAMWGAIIGVVGTVLYIIVVIAGVSAGGFN